MTNQRPGSFINGKSTTSGETIKVLIVDDSAFMRHVISRELTADPSISIVGTANNGLEAIEQAISLHPDVITLDIEMPRMGGLEALPKILEKSKARVVMLSSVDGPNKANTVKALELGAVDFILKPSGSISPNLSSIHDTLINAVKRAYAAQVRKPLAPIAAGKLFASNASAKTKQVGAPAHKIIIIGSSTGGPQALTVLVPQLQIEPDVGYVIVQHMPAGFTASLSARLNDMSALQVREAAAGDIVHTGEALVAPGDYHLRFASDTSGIKITLDQAPRVHGVRPSVDVAFFSAAEVLSGRVHGVVLTGMGSDGASGAGAIISTQGWVLTQNESSCVIYGMPRSVVEAGFSTAVYSIQDMAGAIASHLHGASSYSRKGA